MNDVDLVVTGEPIDIEPQPLRVDASGSRLIATIEVDETLAGTAPAEDVSVYAGQSIALEGTSLARVEIGDADLCSPGMVLLFLNETKEPGIYEYGAQSWARFDDTGLSPYEGNRLFDGFDAPQELFDAVTQLAAEQQAQGLLPGVLVCESKRTSDRYRDPIVCPGAVFNPYEAFRLASVTEGFVVTTDPGPSQLAIGRSDLSPHDLSAISRTLDVQVTLDPDRGHRPDDLLTVKLSASDPVDDAPGVSIWYSPSAATIQVTASGGSFPAPPSFQAAMEPFLAPSE